MTDTTRQDGTITATELHDLRALLPKLKEDHGTPEWLHQHINQVYAVTSVVVDQRRGGGQR